MIGKSNTSVRRATLDDANLLSQLGARTFEETFAADNTAEDMEAYLASNFNLDEQTAQLSDPAAIFLIAEVDGAAAGYAKLQAGKSPESIEGAKPIELVRLYVSQTLLGSGVGAALMQACLDEAHRAGYATIWLGVWERNARAQAFYRKWDFRAVGKHMFRLGLDEQTDILMERVI